MADETPPDTTPHRPPVHMGLRVLARHSAGRHGGRALAHEVVEAHRPKHDAARLKPVAARSFAPPPPPPAPPSATPSEFVYESYDAPAVMPAAPSVARSAAAAPHAGPSNLPRGMSDFAAQWLFGDQSDAQASLMSMAE